MIEVDGTYEEHLTPQGLSQVEEKILGYVYCQGKYRFLSRILSLLGQKVS